MLNYLLHLTLESKLTLFSEKLRHRVLEGDFDQSRASEGRDLGDTTTLADAAVVEAIRDQAAAASED